MLYIAYFRAPRCGRLILFFFQCSFHELVQRLRYSNVSQYGVDVCALRLRAAGGVDFCVILPSPPLPQFVLSTLPLFLSRSLSLSLSPSVSPSPTHLMLPPTHLPSFYPVSSANTLPCRVGHVMKKWPVRALHRASYFIISRAFLPFTVRLWSGPLSFFLCFAFSPLSAPATCKGET